METLRIDGSIYKNYEMNYLEGIYISDIDKESLFEQVLDLLLDIGELFENEFSEEEKLDILQDFRVDVIVEEADEEVEINYIPLSDDEFLGTQFLDYVKDKGVDKLVPLLERVI